MGFVIFFLLGFPHSAFCFGNESNSVHSSIDGSLIPSGALISVLQKGVQFVEAEASLAEVRLKFISEFTCSSLEPPWPQGESSAPTFMAFRAILYKNLTINIHSLFKKSWPADNLKTIIYKMFVLGLCFVLCYIFTGTMKRK